MLFINIFSQYSVFNFHPTDKFHKDPLDSVKISVPLDISSEKKSVRRIFTVSRKVNFFFLITSLKLNKFNILKNFLCC